MINVPIRTEGIRRRLNLDLINPLVFWNLEDKNTAAPDTMKKKGMIQSNRYSLRIERTGLRTELNTTVV
jgi:hypothetical protein